MDNNLIEEISMSSEYLVAIGRVMVNFNQLDAIFDMLLIKLFGCRMWDIRSHMVISGMNFASKQELARALANLHVSEDQAFVKKINDDLMPRLLALSITRNAVAHYKWAVSDGDDMRGIRIQAKGKLKITEAPIPLEELEQASIKMLSLANEIFRMIPLAEFAERFSAEGAE